MWDKVLLILAGRPPLDYDLGPRLVDIWLVQQELLERINELEAQCEDTLARADKALEVN